MDREERLARYVARHPGTERVRPTTCAVCGGRIHRETTWRLPHGVVRSHAPWFHVYEADETRPRPHVPGPT